MRAVLEEADARGVPVRRVSQGSGVMMLTDVELDEMAQLGADARRRGLALPRAARGLGHGRPVARHRGRRVASRAARPASSSASRRSRAASLTGSAPSSSPTSARSQRSALRQARRPAARPRAQDVGAAAVRQPARPHARWRSSARRRSTSPPISRCAELGELRGACCGAARRLRRGARRPGRLRPLLRGAGHDPGRFAAVRQARPAQRAEHLSGRAPPDRSRRQARARAGRRAELVLRLLAERAPELVEAAARTGPRISRSRNRHDRARTPPHR